jgi:hypothetical protein
MVLDLLTDRVCFLTSEFEQIRKLELILIVSGTLLLNILIFKIVRSKLVEIVTLRDKFREYLHAVFAYECSIQIFSDEIHQQSESRVDELCLVFFCDVRLKGFHVRGKSQERG